MSEFVRDKIRAIVRDPETARKLLPDYHFGTKRLILDNGYFETYNRDNVALVDLREDPIEAFTPSGVRTAHGEYPIDVLVLATGFDAVSGSMLKLDPKGRGGVSLREKWAGGLRHLPRHDGRRLPEPVHDPRAGLTGCVLHHAARRRAAGGVDRSRASATSTRPGSEPSRRPWRPRRAGAARSTRSPIGPCIPRPSSWYTGANIPGKPRQFLGHLLGSQYFDRLTEVADGGFEGFVVEERRSPDVAAMNPDGPSEAERAASRAGRRAAGSVRGVILSDRTLREQIAAGRIVVDPFDDALIQPSSIDVRVSQMFRVFRNHTAGVIDVKADMSGLTELVEIDPDGDEPFMLHPGEFVLGSTLERVGVPTDLVGRVEGKSSLGRLGLLIHSTAGFIDAGFDGHITLELANVASLPITIYAGMRIGQISFMEMTTPAEHPYGSTVTGSKYAGQRGPTPSRYHENFDR